MDWKNVVFKGKDEKKEMKEDYEKELKEIDMMADALMKLTAF